MKALLEKLGIRDRASFSLHAFSRNLGLVSAGEQLQLAETRVAIPGLGGVGGVHLITLARSGIGKFHLADFDTFSLQNFNRQYGAKVSALDGNKLDVMCKEALDINPFLDIKKFPQGISEQNIDEFLDGVDVVVDSLDAFAIDMRRLLFARAREKGIHVVTAGPVGFSAVLLVFSPHKGMSFDEYFQIRDEMDTLDKSVSFQVGITPDLRFLKYFDLSHYSLENRTAPSLGLACQLCSGVAAAEVLRIVLQRGGITCAPHHYQFDPYTRRMRKGYLLWGNRNPLQRLKLAGVKRAISGPTLRATSAPEIPQTSDFPRLAHFLIGAAIQAPSGDNCQPWQFQVGENSIQIHLNPLSDNSPFNSGQFASLVACGAALENVCVAAKANGSSTKTTIYEERDANELVANVDISQSAVAADTFLFGDIWRRTTNRRMYQKRPLLPLMRDSLQKSVEEFPRVKLSLLEGKDKLAQLTDVIEKIDRIRVENQGMHEFLYRSIRFSRQEARETQDGMGIDVLEVGQSGKLFLQFTRSWKVMSLLNKFGFSRYVSHIASRGMKHCSAAILLTVPSLGQKDLILGGQAMQRLWLQLTHLGLYAQPMAALPILRNQWMVGNKENFGPKHMQVLEEVWRSYQVLFPNVNMEEEGQVILLRLGFDHPFRLSRTARKPVSSVLRLEDSQAPSRIRKRTSDQAEKESESARKV